MVKSLKFFSFGKLQQLLYKSKFFCFGQILFHVARTFAVHHEKTFVPAFFKVSIDHLFDILESEKRFGKKCGKSLEIWIQKSVRTLCLELGVLLKEKQNDYLTQF